MRKKWMIVCTAALLLLDMVYLIYGSLEMFPTQESQEKLRVSAGLIALVLILVMGLFGYAATKCKT